MILLDTHVWLWLNGAVKKIPPELLKLLSPRDQSVYLSAASVWEIGIKYSLGKLVLPDPPEIFIPACLEENGINALPVRHDHAIRAASLPRHHRDPFDRMLVAQAQLETLKLVTTDSWISSYDVETLWRPA